MITFELLKYDGEVLTNVPVWKSSRKNLQLSKRGAYQPTFDWGWTTYLEHDTPQRVYITFIGGKRVISQKLRGTPPNGPTDCGRPVWRAFKCLQVRQSEVGQQWLALVVDEDIGLEESDWVINHEFSLWPPTPVKSPWIIPLEWTKGLFVRSAAMVADHWLTIRQPHRHPIKLPHTEVWVSDHSRYRGRTLTRSNFSLVVKTLRFKKSLRLPRLIQGDTKPIQQGGPKFEVIPRSGTMFLWWSLFHTWISRLNLWQSRASGQSK